MPKATHNTKSRIVSAAWKLFYENGFDNTTIDDIVELSDTSKGSFYHYFDSKESLLGSLAQLFDEKYTELEPLLTDKSSCMEKLLFINHELFFMIETSVDIELLSRMYSQQLGAKGQKELLDPTRVYYKLLRRIVMEGQEKGEFTKNKPATEIVRFYALCERALLYDWCLRGGDYSLNTYAASVMPIFLRGITEKN